MWWVIPGVDSLEVSLGYEIQTGAGAVGRPSAARTMGASSRSRCRNRGNVCLVRKRPETESHAPCPPGAGNRPGSQGQGKPLTHRTSPPNLTVVSGRLVPPSEVSEIVRNSPKSSLWVGCRTRARNSRFDLCSDALGPPGVRRGRSQVYWSMLVISWEVEAEGSER